MKPIIRFMTLDDLEHVLAIENQVFPDPWSRRSFEFEIIANRFSSPWVLILQEQLIGYAVVWHVFEEYHIANIAIHPDYQGHGWGKYFLRELLERAGDHQYALLEVRERNNRAIKLYEKMGFKKIGIRRRYYLNGDNAIVMKKILHKQPIASR